MRIGIIGLGLVGRALARRLKAAGHAVLGCDIAAAACEQACAIGVDVREDAQDIARNTDLILLSLLTSEDRRALLWGAQQLADALPDGMILLDATTGRPADIEADHARLAAQGVRLVDVCLSGSSQVIAEHRALALVGDREENAGPYRDVLAACAQNQYYFGGPGQGNRAKLIVNLVFGLNRLVLAEALSLAAHAGFDTGLMLEVLRAGETYSTVMDTKGPKMVSGVFEPLVARLAQHAKDVGLILEFAREVGAPAPVSEIHDRLIREAVARGFGDCDNAAIIRAYWPEVSAAKEK